MRPSARSNKELLAWAAAIIAQAQTREIHGEIRIQMKAGTIASVRVEESFLPPKDGEGLTDPPK